MLKYAPILLFFCAGGALAAPAAGAAAPARPGFGLTYAVPPDSGGAGFGAAAPVVSGHLFGPSKQELRLQRLKTQALELQTQDGGKLTPRHLGQIQAQYDEITANR